MDALDQRKRLYTGASWDSLDQSPGTDSQVYPGSFLD